MLTFANNSYTYDYYVQIIMGVPPGTPVCKGIISNDNMLCNCDHGAVPLKV